MIPVTKPFIPPIKEYQKYIQTIWENGWLTNHGPLVNELESKLKEYLGVEHLLFLTNGTIALQIAIKALGLKGEIITTPYSYVATTSSIVWEGCEPVFVDIDKKTFNIDPQLIEGFITPKTSAIIATHVYGIPCDVVAIEKIAQKHNLKVIYDAAHAFGVKVNGKSIFEYGDISTTSFHATKLFHTIEGGAVFTKDPDLLKKMSLLRNFGHTSPISFDGIGINGKNSEFHAAMGLCNLKYIKEILDRRKESSLYYDRKLKGLKVQKLAEHLKEEYNFAYYPIVFEDEEILNKSIEKLQSNFIFPRRYFYPSLTKLNYVKKQTCQNSEDTSKRVICLPLFHTISRQEQELICQILINTQKY